LLELVWVLPLQGVADQQVETTLLQEKIPKLP
jgi:hypothetical protein